METQGSALGAEKSLRMITESKRLHAIARGLDELFKVLYPVIFIVFLFVYGFVVVQSKTTCT